MFYPKKTPRFIQCLYPNYSWSSYTDSDQVIYLTFDDGPEAEVTPWVLNELNKYNAKATFFCVGENVTRNPEIKNSIIEQGHLLGNHTHNHLNGWKTKDSEYLNNVRNASQWIDSKLFRPPYGKLKRSQRVALQSEYRIIMWDVLTGDFDKNLSPQHCLDKSIAHTESGSIIVFHDSQKAKNTLKYVLPRFLDYFCTAGFSMRILPFGTN